MIILTTLAACAASSFTVYVNPLGNDDNTGTASFPVASIAAAQTRVRNIRQGDISTHATILVAEGTYYFTKGIFLDTQDSNTTIQGNGSVHFTGATQINNWKALGADPFASTFTRAARINIYVADLNSQLSSDTLTMLESPFSVASVDFLENGTPSLLPSYPAAGSWIRSTRGSENDTYTWMDPTPGRWSSSDQIWCSAFPQYDWCYSLSPLGEIDSSAKSATSATPVQYGVAPGSRISFINVPEELTKQGEWYLNRSTGKVYCWPTNSADSTSITILNEPLISGGNLVNNITLANLNLEGGRSSGISFYSCDSITLNHCVINGFAADGIDLEAAKNCSIQSCKVSNVGNVGITLQGGSPTTYDAGNIVSDTVVRNFAQWNQSNQPGILLQGSGNTATHNEIFYSPDQAIMVNGSDETITYNRIHDVCTEALDAGAVYMGREPLSRGALIEGNCFYNVGPRVSPNPQSDSHVAQVYLDDLWPGATIRGNYFGGSDTAIEIGGGRDTTVEYNIFFKNCDGVSIDDRGITWAESQATWGGSWHFLDDLQAGLNNYYSLLTAKYPAIADATTNNPLFPVRTKIDNNVGVSNSQFIVYDGLTQSQLEMLGNVSLANGSIADAMNAMAKGYSMIPMSQIGTRP